VRRDKRIDCSLLPPRQFIAAAMDLAVVRTAQRHRELIAHLATERSRLRKTQMMRIRGPPTANEAGLFYDMPDVVAIANATQFRKLYAPQDVFWVESRTDAVTEP
jgi:hypothetical protein